MKEGEEVLQVPEQRLPYSPWRHHGGAGISLQPLERDMLEQISTMQHCRGLHARAGGYFLKDLWPMESPGWSRFSPEGLQPMEGLAVERGSLRKKEQQRETATS